MDTSKLSQGQIIAGVGGLVLVIAQFLSWVSGPFGTSASAFDAFSIMDILMLLVGLAAIGWAAAVAMDAAASFPPVAPWVLFLLAVLVGGWALGWDLEESSAGFGAWLGLVSAAAIAYGAYVAAPPRTAGGPIGAGASRPAAPPPAARPPTAPPPASPPAGGGSSEPPASAPPPADT